jgi:hypothetical protein
MLACKRKQVIDLLGGLAVFLKFQHGLANGQGMDEGGAVRDYGGSHVKAITANGLGGLIGQMAAYRRSVDDGDGRGAGKIGELLG